MDAASNWFEYWTDDGRAYYHNVITGVTQWERPPEFLHSESDDFRGVSTSDITNRIGVGISDSKWDASGYSKRKAGLADANQTDMEFTSLYPYGVSGGARETEVLDIDNRSSIRHGGVIGFQSVPTDQDPTRTDGPLKEQNESKFFCLNFGGVTEYFDTTTSEVLFRILAAVFPFRHIIPPGQPRYEDFRGYPDWYGPVWISTSLVISVFAMSNYASWLTDRAKSTDFAFLGVASALIYGSLFIIPTLAFTAVYLVSKQENSQNPLVSKDGFKMLVCIFGYSLFPYIPASFLCLPPSSPLKWAISVAAFVFALYFTFKSFLRDISDGSRLFKYVFLGYSFLSHLSIFVAFRLYFFHV